MFGPILLHKNGSLSRSRTHRREKKTIKIVKHIQRKLPINGDGSGKKLKNQKKKKENCFSYNRPNISYSECNELIIKKMSIVFIYKHAHKFNVMYTIFKIPCH